MLVQAQEYQAKSATPKTQDGILSGFLSDYLWCVLCPIKLFQQLCSYYIWHCAFNALEMCYI